MMSFQEAKEELIFILKEHPNRDAVIFRNGGRDYSAKDMFVKVQMGSALGNAFVRAHQRLQEERPD